MQRLSRTLLICALTVTTATAATAGIWGGNNGNVRLTFSEGPEYQQVAELETMPKAGVILDLYAVLAEVDQVSHNDEKYLSVGGWEMQLSVDGAEWEILEVELPEDSINAGSGKGCLYVGKYTGVKFDDGAARLARWRIRLLGDPKNVTFSLDPEGLNSCELTPDCPEGAPHVLWTGSGAAGQVGILFGAGCYPAYLNWEGDTPDVELFGGKGSWRDTGLFTMDE